MIVYCIIILFIYLRKDYRFYWVQIGVEVQECVIWIPLAPSVSIVSRYLLTSGAINFVAVGKLIVQIELAISIAICIALCSSDDSALLRSRSQFVPKALVSFGVCTLKIFVCKATSSTPLVLEWNFFTILYLKINQD